MSSLRAYASTPNIKHLSSRQNDLQSLDVFSRWTILECSGSRRIGSNRTTKKAASFCRVWWIQQTFIFNCALKIREDDAGLRNGAKILTVNTFDSIESVGCE